MVAADLLPSLEGVELGAIGKVNVHLIFTVVMRNRKHRNTGIIHINQLDSKLFLSVCPPQTVSYAQFLYPTNALVRQKSGGGPETCTAQTLQSGLRGNGQRNFTPARLNNCVAQEPSMTLTGTHLILLPLADLRCGYTCSHYYFVFFRYGGGGRV